MSDQERQHAERIVSAVFACKTEDTPMPFALYRHQDVTGVSGPGTVAHGVQFADGTVVLRWLGEHASTVVWESLEHAMHVHGHDGKTHVVWLAAEFSEMAKAEEEAAAAERERIRSGKPVCPAPVPPNVLCMVCLKPLCRACGACECPDSEGLCGQQAEGGAS